MMFSSAQVTNKDILGLKTGKDKNTTYIFTKTLHKQLV